MKSITLAFAASVALSGAALAQTSPSPATAPKPPTAAPAAPTPPAPQMSQGGQTAPQPPAGAQAAAPAMPAPSGPPEGMVIETPNGFYLVRPGESAPRKLDMGQGGPGAAQPGPQPDDEAMDDGGMQPPPPRPRRPPPPPEGKGARLRIHTPNLDVNVKCPDDEPVKACIDAVSQLMDKANATAH